MSGEGEFGYIRRRLAPLAAGYPGAFDLTDDAAVLSVPEGHELVVTSDTLVEGVHFLAADPPESVAIKTLRVSLSDLAAMGADPHGALLSIAWPATGGAAQREAFADGLARELGDRAIPLIGGDTTTSPGPWTLTGTLFGTVPEGQAVRRSGARPGDELYVTGTIGDAGLGLLSLQGEGGLGEAIGRYRQPPVRGAIAPALRATASAAIDVSDGLIADAGHVASASGCALVIDLTAIPLSPVAKSWCARQGTEDQARAQLASFGDDYELLVCLAPDRAGELAAAAQSAGFPLTRIGRIEAGQGVRVLGAKGEPVEIAKGGFTHF